MDDVAKAIGLAGASSYQRYENPDLFKDQLLSLEKTRALAALLTGKGQPPIEADEVLALGGVQSRPGGGFEAIDMGVAVAAGVRALREESEVYEAAGAPRPDKGSWPKDVRVLGTAVGGANGDFEMNGEVIDLVRRPPGIRNAKDVFAIYVQGDSMSPWKEPGDLVYLQGQRPARPGDYVVIQLKPPREGDSPRAYLKRLVRSAGPALIVMQYNPRIPEMPIPVQQIDRIYRVMTLEELMGV